MESIRKSCGDNSLRFAVKSEHAGIGSYIITSEDLSTGQKPRFHLLSVRQNRSKEDNEMQSGRIGRNEDGRCALVSQGLVTRPGLAHGYRAATA